MKTAAVVLNWVYVGLVFIRTLIGLIPYALLFSAGIFVLFMLIPLISVGVLIVIHIIIMRALDQQRYVLAGTLSFFFGFFLSSLYIFLLPLYEGERRDYSFAAYYAGGKKFALTRNIEDRGRGVPVGTLVTIYATSRRGAIYALYSTENNESHLLKLTPDDLETPKTSQ